MDLADATIFFSFRIIIHAYFLLRDGSACLSYHLDSSVRRDVPHRRVSSGEDEYAVRNGQVRHRAREVSRTLDLVASLVQGGSKINNLLERVEDQGLLEEIGKVTDVERPIVTGIWL